MISSRYILTLALAAGIGAVMAPASEPAPPLITTAATTTLDSGGRPWAYLVFGENQPGLLASRRLAIYVKLGAPDATASFVGRGLAASTTDPTAIQVLLARGASVGDNLPALEAQLIALHRQLINTVDSRTPATVDPPAMPLAQRLSALLGRAAGDSALAQWLNLQALAHPALRMVMGTAWAGPLNVAVGAAVTLEVRERNATGADIAVIGRVTIRAGQPEILPAPGPLVAVPDTTSAGDLNVKLRWATPDPLRQAGTRHHGDVVWRVDRVFAEAQGFNNTPPSGASLDGLSVANPAQVKRVGGPVFPSKLFTVTNVADFIGDATTTYFTDNNDRYAAGGTMLNEGAQFYYFAAAADALGKPGTVSGGVLATVYRRLPPPVPTKLAVINQWTPSSGQYLEVSWQVNASGDGTSTTRYEVFRGDDLAQHASAQRGEVNFDAVPIVAGLPDAIQRIAIVPSPATNTAALLHVTDNGNGVLGKTWWFATRAIHASPPGGTDLSSALGPPVFGALRDRTAPPTPAVDQFTPPVVTGLRVACIRDVPPINEIATDPLDTSTLQFIARCDRRPGVNAAHFQVLDTVDNSVVVPETKVAFGEDESTAEWTWTLPLSAQSHTLDVQCRAEALGGITSTWAHSSAAGVAPDGNHRSAHHFLAGAIGDGELAASSGGDALWTALLSQPPAPWPADLHLTVSPLSGQIFHPRLCVALAPRSEQYRVYRRVEAGPLTVITQGLHSYTGPGCALIVEDPAPPISNGHIQYFAQLLDEAGRPSAMRKLGALRFTGDTPPTPVLLTPGPADFGSTNGATTINLSWVCPPEHVERFEIFYTTAKPSSDPNQGISATLGGLSKLTLKTAGMPAVFKVTSKLDAITRTLRRIEQSLLTGRVGGDLGAGPRFTVAMQVDASLKYTVWLRALGPNGEPSLNSRSLDFQWQPPAMPAPDIAWPARPLPPVAAFNRGISVVDFSDLPAQRLIWSYSNLGAIPIPQPSVSVVTTPVGIRVGSLAIDNDQARRGFDTAPPNGPIFYTPTASKTLGKADPNQQLFTRDTDATQKLLPCVLYRQQVTNDVFPSVSGDVVQCSPLIRSVAWLNLPLNAQVQLAELADPFFRWVGPDLPATPALELYLVDTQPVVATARYRYWLMRFSDVGEPIQTVPCGEVTIKSP